MKIVFINVSLRPDSQRRHLPVGLAYVITAVKKSGFDFDLIDMDIDQLDMSDFEKILSKQAYDVYAMGCIVTGYKWVKNCSHIIKKINPEATIIAGNSIATSIPEILLNDTKVDIGVLGEGDVTIVELLRSIELKKDIVDIPGIIFKHDGGLVKTKARQIIPDLDTIGFPDWDIFDLDQYSAYGQVNANAFSGETIQSYPLNSARGCPFDCTFCYHVFKGNKYRKYSEQSVMNEIIRLHKDYNCTFISFWDELSFPSIKSVENMVGRMGKLDFQIGWEATTRGDLFNAKHVSLIRDMRAVGAESLSFSLENADSQILKAMNKKMGGDEQSMLI